MKGILATAFLVVAASAYCQKASMNGWGLESSYNKLYNAQNETSIKGRITKILDRVPESGMSPATTIQVREANGRTVNADLGPEWFLKNQRRHLAVGAEVSVTGSTASIGDKNTILARKVVEGNHVLYLRELTGFPLWVAVRPSVVVLNLERPTGQAASTAGPGEASSDTGPVAIAEPPPAPTSTANNQSRPASGANNANGPTVQGTIEKTMAVQDPQTGQVEDYLVVNTPNGEVNVDIGPAWYQQQQPVTWNLGGNVTMTGGVGPASPAIVMGTGPNPIILPTGIQYGGQYMVLRPGGINIWNSWY